MTLPKDRMMVWKENHDIRREDFKSTYRLHFFQAVECQIMAKPGKNGIEVILV